MRIMVCRLLRAPCNSPCAIPCRVPASVVAVEMAIGASPLLSELNGISAKKCQLDLQSAEAAFQQAERTTPISNDVAFPSFLNIEDEAM